MSTYTTEVRYICETYADLSESVGYADVDDVIAASWDKIFDFDFPLFDEDYREALCSKILRHYYTREIGAETVARWKLFLRDTLDLQMPIINGYYQTAQLTLSLDPTHDVDYTRTHTTTSQGTQQTDGETHITTGSNTSSESSTTTEGTTSNTTEGTASSQSTATNSSDGLSTSEATAGAASDSRYSDTPQGALTGVEDGRYLTNATAGTSSSTNSSESESRTSGSSSSQDRSETGSTAQGSSSGQTDMHGSSTASGTETGTSSNTIGIHNVEDYVEHVVGKMGAQPPAALIKQFREILVSADQMVIDALADCFMMIY